MTHIILRIFHNVFDLKQDIRKQDITLQIYFVRVDHLPLNMHDLMVAVPIFVIVLRKKLRWEIEDKNRRIRYLEYPFTDNALSISFNKGTDK